MLREGNKSEQRVAITPDAVAKYRKLDIKITVETGAGVLSNITDEAFQDAGAIIAKTPASCLRYANVLLCVQAPDISILKSLKPGSLIIGMLDPGNNKELLAEYNNQEFSACSLELLPRISRAQSMDVLSSQSNLAGYRAVIEAIHVHGKVLPMMMTAAGTIPPAKVLVLGAGVAGLQAIATAKRLGAVVWAFDVRAAAKEQVESLGGKFIEVKNAGR